MRGQFFVAAAFAMTSALGGTVLADDAAVDWQAVNQQLARAGADLDQAAKQLAQFASENKLTPHGTRGVQRVSARIEGDRTKMQGVIDAAKQLAAAAATATPADAARFRAANLAALNEAAAAVRAEKAALDDATFLAAPRVGRVEPTAAAPPIAAPRGSGEVVSACDLTFESADGSPMLVGVDGYGVHQVPWRVHLLSGRHIVHVRQGSASVDRPELLLCAFLSTIPVEPIK